MKADPITYEDLAHLPPEAVSRRSERYYKVAIKTRLNLWESSRRSVRASPLPNQGFPPDLNVSCGLDLRENNPPGSVFIVWAKLTFDYRNDAYFLFSHPRWRAEKIEESEAKILIEQKKIGITNYYPKSAIPKAQK